MSDDDVIESFDRQIASAWAFIGIGAFKATEHTIELIAREWIDVSVIGLDISVIALYLLMFTAGTTLLIFAKTIANAPDPEPPTNEF